MDIFKTFDEAMSKRASRMEAMQVFEGIQGYEITAPEQMSAVHETVTRMLLVETLASDTNSSSSQRHVPIFEGVGALLDSINVGDCVHFLVRFLEQHGSTSPTQDKILTKKMLRKIAKELKVLPQRNRSIIKNEDIDVMSNWRPYVVELIKEMKVVQRRCSLDIRNSGVYVLTHTPYDLILETIAENL